VLESLCIDTKRASFQEVIRLFLQGYKHVNVLVKKVMDFMLHMT